MRLYSWRYRTTGLFAHGDIKAHHDPAERDCAMRLPPSLSARLFFFKWATTHCSPLSTPALHNRRIPFFLPLICSVCPSPSPFESHHSPLSHSPHLCQSLFLALSPCSNQCSWWIIHSVQWGLKLFDWQLYSPVCYIINIPPLGIVAMVKAITGQRRVSSLMERLTPPVQSHTLHLFLLPSLQPWFHDPFFPLWFGLSSWRSMLGKSTQGWTNELQVAFQCVCRLSDCYTNSQKYL